MINDGCDRSLDNQKEFWRRKSLCYLKRKDPKILQWKAEWLKDRIMDTVQKLIRNALDTTSNNQSVINCQQKISKTFQRVSQEHMQLLDDAVNHWFLNFCSNSRVQTCDTLKTSTIQEEFLSICFLYKAKKMHITKYA